MRSASSINRINDFYDQSQSAQIIYSLIVFGQSVEALQCGSFEQRENVGNLFTVKITLYETDLIARCANAFRCHHFLCLMSPQTILNAVNTFNFERLSDLSFVVLFSRRNNYSPETTNNADIVVDLLVASFQFIYTHFHAQTIRRDWRLSRHFVFNFTHVG